MPTSERLTLVLLPGMHGTGRLSTDFVEALPDSFLIEIVEYPEQEFLGYDKLLERVDNICSSKAAFALIAESFSTPLAIEIAATGAQNLRGLVLCAGFATNPAKRWRRLFAWLILPLGCSSSQYQALPLVDGCLEEVQCLLSSKPGEGIR